MRWMNATGDGEIVSAVLSGDEDDVRVWQCRICANGRNLVALNHDRRLAPAPLYQYSH